MLGQWALGQSPLGEPEEFTASSPAPADAIVWFTVATLANVEISASDTIVDIEE